MHSRCRQPSPRSLARTELASFDMARRSQESFRRARTPATVWPISQFRKQFGDVCGVVLSVAVESHNDLPAGLLHAEEQRRSLAVIPTKMKRPRLWPVLCRFIKPLPCSIGSCTIIHEDPFISLSDGTTTARISVSNGATFPCSLKKGTTMETAVPWHWISKPDVCGFVCRRLLSRCCRHSP